MDCRRGVDCVVQQYPDLDLGPGVRDPGCGARSYDGHKGVDIRLISFADLGRGVKVLAAADGVVRRLRNTAPERRFENGVLRAPEARVPDCGNGLVIEHADGFETQYCHLKRGGVLARPGQAVRAGDPIGVVGLSGRTAFPHLHVTFRKDGAVIDPFTGLALGSACDAKKAAGGASSLWADETLAYEPVALLDAGIAGRKPSYAEAKAGTLGSGAASRSSPALVGWARLLGLGGGDMVRLALRGPGGETLAVSERRMTKSRAVQFLIAGRRARGLWPAGAYRLTITARRRGRLLLQEERSFALGR